MADRYITWVCALAALVCALLAPRLDPQAWETQRWRFLGDRAITALLEHADLEVELAEPAARLPLALQGMNMRPAQNKGLRQAMVRHLGVREDPSSAHRLLAATHSWGDLHAVELRLLRRGWALRMQSLERMVHRPWIPALALLLAGVCLLGTMPGWLTMPIAAGLAQALLAQSRRGEPYRALPVAWTEWPQALYVKLELAWTRAVWARPEWSCAFALVCLGAAFWVSQRSKRAGKGLSLQQLAVFGLWFVSSLVWWDACFRTALPLSQLEVSGAGLMRLGHALRALAWLSTGFVLLRTHRAHHAPQAG